MKAIILAAGIGKRLKPITDTTPKCLISVGGRTVLDRFLEGVVACGIDEIVLVVGHLREQIRATVGEQFGGVDVRTIDNDVYEKGSILSLWAARDELTRDALIMDADVIFHPRLLKKLVESPHANCVLMDTSAQATGEEMMLAARSGRVTQIARTLEEPYDVCGEGVGFLKLSGAAGTLLAEQMAVFLKAGDKDGCEYEDALNLFFQDVAVGFESVESLPWTELDFIGDVERAEKEILPRIPAAR